MKRRSFIVLAGSAAVSPLCALAQPVLPRLGVLSGGTPNSDFSRRSLAALEQGLAENGMTRNRDYILETRFAEGDYGRFPELARELQQAKVNIILPSTIAAVRAAQNLSPAIPVVMPAINDPVGTGLIATLSHPGGHTTGMATLIEDVTSKLLEFIGLLVPRASVLAAVYNPANPSNLTALQGLRREAGPRGISLIEFAFKPPPDWEATFSAIAARHPDALQVVADYAVLDQAERIAALALAQRLPTLSASGDIPQHEGILLTYGPSIVELWRRSAYYVRRVLAGTEPSDLPVEQATRIKLVINLRTAQTLGLDVPAQLLARADEVIE